MSFHGLGSGGPSHWTDRYQPRKTGQQLIEEALGQGPNRRVRVAGLTKRMVTDLAIAFTKGSEPVWTWIPLSVLTAATNGEDVHPDGSIVIPFRVAQAKGLVDLIVAGAVV